MAERRRFFWLILLGGLLGATACYAVLRFVTGTKGVSTPAVLPDSTVVEDTVADEELIRQLAAKQELLDTLGLHLENVTGQLRTAEDELVDLRAQIAIDTGPTQPPDPVVIVKTVTEACEDPEIIEPLGRIRADLLKFEGVTAEMDRRYGWAGEVVCSLSLSGGSQWVELVREHLTFANVEAASTEPPAPLRTPSRLGYYAEVANRLSPRSYNYDVVSLSSMEAGGGVSVRIGQRWHWSAGLAHDGEDFLARTRLTWHPWVD